MVLTINYSKSLERNFCYKKCEIFILWPLWRAFRVQEKTPANQENIQHFKKKWNIFTFFHFFHFFSFRDPNPDPKQCNTALLFVVHLLSTHVLLFWPPALPVFIIFWVAQFCSIHSKYLVLFNTREKNYINFAIKIVLVYICSKIRELILTAWQ